MGSLSDTLRLEVRPFGIDVLHVVTGSVATKFHANERGKVLPDTSLYLPAADVVDQKTQALLPKKNGSLSPEEYARTVVAEVLKSSPSTTIWVGGMSWVCWLSTVLWDSIRDRVIERIWGMASLKSTLGETDGKNGAEI